MSYSSKILSGVFWHCIIISCIAARFHSKKINDTNNRDMSDYIETFQVQTWIIFMYSFNVLFSLYVKLLFIIDILQSTL